MRGRILLLVLLAGGLAVGGGITAGASADSLREVTAATTALARADLADVPAPSAASRTRDGIGRDHDARRDVAAWLAVAFALTLAGGWSLARERAARVGSEQLVASRRPRAPPLVPSFVHC